MRLAPKTSLEYLLLLMFVALTGYCKSRVMNNEFAIESQELSKRYEGDVLAVDGVDLAIPTNSIYALLRPTGREKQQRYPCSPR